MAKARLIATRLPLYQRPQYFYSLYFPSSRFRSLHSARRVKSVAASDLVTQVDSIQEQPYISCEAATQPNSHTQVTNSALDLLPFSNVLRTYLITSITSSAILLPLCFGTLRLILSSSSPILNIDKNPILRWGVNHTFYPQFCAGKSIPEVRRSLENVRGMGFDGVILESSLEIVESQVKSESTSLDDDAASLKTIEMWQYTMVDSINMTGPGDFLGIKWSGLGPKAFQRLRKDMPPSPAMYKAMTEVCDFAESRGVRLLPSAEEDETNVGIDAWSLMLQKIYNRPERLAKSAHLEPEQALIFTTYQLYLKSTPSKIARHLAQAHLDGYILGIKLVRGAYLATERRDKIWSTKEGTDEAYDTVVEGLLRRQYNDMLQPVLVDGSPAEFPKVNVFIASHNRDSVRKVQAIRNEQAHAALGVELPDLYYAQLYGMADEISCELAQSARQIREEMAIANQTSEKRTFNDIPKTVKCIAWGTPGECLQYLFRRAAENQEAATRTIDTKDAMRIELWRRIRGCVRQ